MDADLARALRPLDDAQAARAASSQRERPYEPPADDENGVGEKAWGSH